MHRAQELKKELTKLITNEGNLEGREGLIRDVLLYILQDTIEHYKINPRSCRGWDSLYVSTVDGVEVSRCAVGRYLSESTIKDLEATGRLCQTIGSLITKELIINNQPLKPGVVLGLRYFWELLQKLHDDSSNWRKKREGGNILTERGMEKAKELKEWIKDWSFLRQVYYWKV